MQVTAKQLNSFHWSGRIWAYDSSFSARWLALSIAWAMNEQIKRGVKYAFSVKHPDGGDATEYVITAVKVELTTDHNSTFEARQGTDIGLLIELDKPDCPLISFRAGYAPELRIHHETNGEHVRASRFHLDAIEADRLSEGYQAVCGYCHDALTDLLIDLQGPIPKPKPFEVGQTAYLLHVQNRVAATCRIVATDLRHVENSNVYDVAYRFIWSDKLHFGHSSHFGDLTEWHLQQLGYLNSTLDYSARRFQPEELSEEMSNFFHYADEFFVRCHEKNKRDW